MKERRVEIETPDGPMETFVIHPEEGGPFPPVVVYMDIWGVREELYDIARRVATVGYYCLVPDLYHREGRVRFEFRDEDGNRISAQKIDPAIRQEVVDMSHRVTDAIAVSDTAALLDFMDHGEPVRAGAVGCVGFCMGGRHALVMAGNYPERFRACASLHGALLVTDGPDSAHLVAAQAQGELYCGFAEKDSFATPEIIAKLEKSLGSSQATYHREIHKGIDHGYALPERDVYNRQAAARDWEIIFAMFRRQLDPG